MDKNDKNIKSIVNSINNNMDILYKDTYMSTTQQGKDLNNLYSKINSSIDKIINKNMNTIGMPSVSTLYSRISNKNSEDQAKLIEDLGNMFDNGVITDDLYGVFMSNKYLKDYDQEIDVICKYMPKLEEALAVQRDCVLSADHFSKDFLNFEYPNTGVESVFNERSKELKRKYKLQKLVERIYDDTSKYGEQFVYRVPYSLAIGRLLASKSDANPSPFISESSTLKYDNECYILEMNSKLFSIKDIGNNSTILTESFVSNISNNSNINAHNNRSILDHKQSFSIGVEISNSNIIESAVNDAYLAYKNSVKFNKNSLSSMFSEAKDHTSIKASGNIDISGGIKNKYNNGIITNDGLIPNKENSIVKVDAPGCVIKICPRDQVVPIYIEDICMGYYYFELRAVQESDSFLGFKNVLGDVPSNIRNGIDTGNIYNNIDSSKQDETLKYVASQLSKFIDKKFVNNNQDLSREIYMILKYNDLFNSSSFDSIKVSFIPPEDMVHFFFEQDPVTHRGISDLDKALIPAKIYTSLYVTTSIGTLTRGQDKRVYYVKQTVDKNISQSLLNVISQIKQSNFGIRQFNSINNILNITGRFNDYIIPTNASGDSPIQFEVMPGQEIQTPTDLMTSLEEMAINSTGIPIEIIQTRQSVDYAMQLTMSSSKVLRFCYKRQELYEDLLTELITPIYNYEYKESVGHIKVTLPPPSFINVTNTNQLIDNTKNFVNSIVEVEMAGEENEKLKNKYTNELFKHYLGTHLDVTEHSKILERCKIEVRQEENETHSENSGSSDY